MMLQKPKPIRTIALVPNNMQGTEVPSDRLGLEVEEQVNTTMAQWNSLSLHTRIEGHTHSRRLRLTTTE